MKKIICHRCTHGPHPNHKCNEDGCDCNKYTKILLITTEKEKLELEKEYENIKQKIDPKTGYAIPDNLEDRRQEIISSIMNFNYKYANSDKSVDIMKINLNNVNK